MHLHTQTLYGNLSAGISIWGIVVKGEKINSHRNLARSLCTCCTCIYVVEGSLINQHNSVMRGY